jgi:hypothetical protein
VLHQPLLASRRTRLYFVAQNGAAILAALAGSVLIPRLGVEGAAEGVGHEVRRLDAAREPIPQPAARRLRGHRRHDFIPLLRARDAAFRGAATSKLLLGGRAPSTRARLAVPTLADSFAATEAANK